MPELTPSELHAQERCTALRRVSGACRVIREPFIEARCEPIRSGGWRVISSRGTTEHPAVGDPYLAVDRHIARTQATVDAAHLDAMEAATATRAERTNPRRYSTEG